MELLGIAFAVGNLGTPLLLLFLAVALSKRGAKAWQPMLGAMGLWLLQAGVLFHFVVPACAGGRCELTPLEEYGPLVVMAVAYVGIGWLVWIAWRRRVKAPAEPADAKDPARCCGKPALRTELDLGSAGGFELDLARCDACGAWRMKVFCVATGISGVEAVGVSDVERIRSIPAEERKAFLREWVDRHL